MGCTHSKNDVSEQPKLPTDLKSVMGENLPHNVNDRYALGELLGEGGYSKVYLGISKTALQQKVAIKIISRANLQKDDEDALRNEVSILDKLKHPNIVRQLDFFEEPQTYYIVLEYLTGGELFDRIVSKTYYNEKEARDCVKLALRALKYIHEQNIVHRDLKPENLLLTSKDDDADLKLADFGFATIVNGNTLTEQLGTPQYIAPEILEKKHYGTAVDMWSFGVIVFILLGGYPPFSEDNTKKLFKKITAGDWEFHPDYWGSVSKEAKDFISKLLELIPSRRMTADQALHHPWLLKDGKELEKLNLDANLTQLRKHLATRKFKGAVKSVMAVNKMKFLLKERRESGRSLESDSSDKINTVSSAEKA